MLREQYFCPMPGRGLRSALNSIPPLTATIRRTGCGVRIRFSDGRIAWLDRETNVSESGFMGSVSDWARRHGAVTIEIEVE